MELEFTKAHGTGNDFVVLADLDDRLDLSDGLVRALCDRRRGIGGDGVLRITAADDADVFMDYRNADGTVVEMCGNGVRVVAKHAVDHGLVTVADDRLRVATRAGIRDVRVHRGRDGRVVGATVGMGAPILDPAEIPFHAGPAGAVREPVTVDGVTVDLSAVSMGNPHAVLVVDDVATAPVHTLGPLLEINERFPKRTNVEFAQVITPDRVRLRVWERGVGETAACGTGACAAVVALQRLGLADDEATVELPGGVLNVRYTAGTDAEVLLSGGAIEVAHGTLDAHWLTQEVPR